MRKNRKRYTVSKQTATKNVRLVSVGVVVVLMAAGILSIRMNTAASSASAQPDGGPYLVASPSPATTPSSNLPTQTAATRISIFFGEKQDIPVATGVDSVILVSPEIATVEIKNRFLLTITPLKRGETILLITYGSRRQTYIIQVVSRPADYSRNSGLSDGNGKARASKTSGSLITTFSPGLGGGPAVARETLDYRQKLSNGKILHVSGETFKLFGNTDRSLAIASVQDFALNRLSIGLETPTRSLEILDSQVNISPLSLNGYTIRGVHLWSKPKSDPNDNLQAKGIEIFAGLARPSLTFFDTGGGKIAGVMVPVLTTNSFQARTGIIAISADESSRETHGGVTLQADATYAPTKHFHADAEMSYANGDISWRARLDLKYAKYGASGEASRFARSSPLNSIGAQYGGRDSEALSSYWRPTRSLSASVEYSYMRVARITNSRLADYNRSQLFSNVSYAFTKALRMTLRYGDQKIETAFPGSISKFAIKTRTFSIGTTYKFNSNWSNTIEGRINFNREANANAALEKGLSLNEQLRFGWHGGSLTGFLYYNRKSPSVISLIVSNPGLLPPELQSAFALDPAGFIRLNRDRIAFLLGGIELPQTRGVETGVRFQKNIARFTISAESSYNEAEIYATSQKTLNTSGSVGIRLDNANAVQFTGWNSMGSGGRSGLTVSYTYRFGSSEGGFPLFKFLNFNRSHVHGRVFYDLNGNGSLDVGEPGVAGISIQIDGKRSVITDTDGRYQLSANQGSHRVVLVSDDLGVRLLASSPTERLVDSGQKSDVNFGLRDAGSVSGRIFNDSGMLPGAITQNAAGLAGIRLMLRSAETGLSGFVLEQFTGANGSYNFPGLRPGKYSVEIDPATVPANYRIPDIMGSSVIVDPLHGTSYDMPIAAQRAVTGIVFVDKNGDGIYTVGTDEPVRGAAIGFENKTSISSSDGTYLLRNLPAGLITLLVRLPTGLKNTGITVELGPGPVTLRDVNIPVLSATS